MAHALSVNGISWRRGVDRMHADAVLRALAREERRDAALHALDLAEEARQLGMPPDQLRS